MVVTDRLHIEKRAGYHLILDPSAPNWIAADEDGAWTLRQLRAGRTRDDVAYRFAKRAGIGLRRALELVDRFADEVGDLARPALSPPYEGRHRYLQPLRLREVWLHVSDRCNLACRHCLVSSGPAGLEGLETDVLLKTIRQARELGADTFYFTGGEPLLREDLPQVLHEVTESCAATAVVLTNGVLLEGELSDRLSAVPRDRLFFQISLDGSTAARNDALRSTGSFDGAVRGIQAARALGFDVTVATVVLRQNLDDLRAITDLAHNLGVTHLHLMWQHIRERGGGLPRAGLRKLLATVSDVRRHAESIGLVLDNIENVRRTVNGDPGIKYDLSNACWDSLAIHRDGRVYPSACLVGIPSEAAGSVLESPLEKIWLESDHFAQWRARSVIDNGAHAADPWVFLHGGGDPEQAYFAGDGNGRAAVDPYLPLHKAIARQVIDDTVSQRQRLLGDSRCGPVVYQIMGDDGYGCPTEAGVLNGGAHKVDFVHSNCVLIQDVIAKSRAQIRQYYGEAAREPKTEICQPINIDPRHLSHIPDEVIARSYGCGSPVFAADPKPGEAILDLGSGAGMEAFIASRLVGAEGRVIGVDMTPDMLHFATDAAGTVAEKLGYANVSFTQAFLESLPLADASIDAVISNCVVNLSPEKLKVFAEIKRALKPGGRAVISDLVSQAPLPAEIRFNPRLKGECIAGAMTEKKLLSTLEKLGFVGLEILHKNPWRTVDEIGFDTLTVRAHKPAAASRARYHYPGPFRSVTLDSGEELVRGASTEVDSALLPPNGNGRPVAPAAAPTADRHLQDCMVCGSPLVYFDEESSLKCYYCGESKTANARCEEGHFVCDACHARDHVGFIRTYCRNTQETDPIAIFSEMRASHLFPLHGPEHHALVPAAFLTAYRNQFGEPPQGRIEAAVERGAKLPGGTCAYWGGCAAALGIGIAFASILRATPLSHDERGTVQTIVSDILARLGKFANPRCCRRESYLSLHMGCELSRRYLPHALDCGPLPPCDQMALNRECLGGGCPLHPANRD
jgi:MoaA/NifB/PqqE/SkfB family radical SAM enzyme/SAM-dependent methyltransferase